MILRNVRSLPYTYLTLNGQKQTKITTTSKRQRRLSARFLPSINKITWLRKSETEYIGDLWMANPNGGNAKVWIRNIGGYAFFPSKS